MRTTSGWRENPQTAYCTWPVPGRRVRDAGAHSCQPTVLLFVMGPTNMVYARCWWVVLVGFELVGTLLIPRKGTYVLLKKLAECVSVG